MKQFAQPTTYKLSLYLLLASCWLTLGACNSNTSKKTDKPNIIIIYADDMGYGDLNCQNPNSKIPTPNLDKLASEGMLFTDAHSSSGICSPSRYALLTGKYHWRTRHNIVNSFGKPFFKESDVTLPQILKTKGYTTACIGKWHLGWHWPFKNGPSGEIKTRNKTQKVYTHNDIDWTQAIGGGPLDRGFDYYFGDGTINFPPYVWIENDRVVEAPTEEMNPGKVGFETKEGKWEFRPGPKVAGWNPYDVLPTLTTKTVEWIEKQDQNTPFFLYLPLPSPHAPIIPNDEFDGKSQAGGYGDFMFQTDWVIGEVLKTLKNKGLEENTIVIFSSDNGPENYAWARTDKYNHYSMGDFRGLKRDVWEGGHHVPFIIKWPGHIEANSISKEVISQVDVMATLAAITSTTLPANAAPDSYDLRAVIKKESYKTPLREATIHNTMPNIWGIRKGDWVYINHSSGGLKKMPAAFMQQNGYKEFDTKGLLFNMVKDPEQRINLYKQYPEIIMEMDSLLQTYRKESCSYKPEATHNQ
ncbi:sulfatase family protein [Carboxylicivirga marina]|uniref:sulfatase family protein n=1 Tax=Carboxylicivirga marina TaxID=2800988 RepID=UPI00259A5F03|nr:arylsulfatase [uncultured Carboxylicivirga sp.]